MTTNTNTFLRRVAFGGMRFMWGNGRWALRLAGTLVGLLPDMIAESARLAQRWSMPLVDTPADATQYQLRMFGLPAYIEGYFATLDRLRSAWATHAIAGSIAQLEEELARIGFVNPAVSATGVNTWTVDADNVTPGSLLWGAFFYGDGSTWDSDLPLSISQSLVVLLRYFNPAGTRFEFVGGT